MAYRFTNTAKWTNDGWFIDLSPNEKLLFIYICENCDFAGFLELSLRKISFDTGLKNEEIKGAWKGLERCYIISKDNKTIFLKKFLKHQKNLPLNENNKAHLGIIKKLKERLGEFGFNNIDDYFTLNNGCDELGKGLDSPIGIGISNGNGEDKTQKFKKPTIDEIREYCKERNNDVDCEKWLNHYIANGWMVGRNKMKDWKAAIRTWENNNNSNGTTTITGKNQDRFNAGKQDYSKTSF